MTLVNTTPTLIFSDKKVLRVIMDAVARELEIPELSHPSALEAQRLIAIDLANNGTDIQSRPFNKDLEEMRQGE